MSSTSTRRREKLSVANSPPQPWHPLPPLQSLALLLSLFSFLVWHALSSHYTLPQPPSSVLFPPSSSPQPPYARPISDLLPGELDNLTFWLSDGISKSDREPFSEPRALNLISRLTLPLEEGGFGYRVVGTSGHRDAEQWLHGYLKAFQRQVGKFWDSREPAEHGGPQREVEVWRQNGDGAHR